MKIDRIKIKNFKSLKDIDINLSNLTLLTGINSTGKSSVIQSILLFKQNQEKFYSLRGSKIINSNDKYVRIGNIKDILYEEIFDENIEIKILNKNTIQNLELNTDTLEIENITIISEEKENIFNIFFDDFQYIETDRISPQIFYSLSAEIDNNLIGTTGEYTAHYLAENRHKDINIKTLKHLNSKTSQLLENVSLWLGEISSEIEIKTKIYKELNQVSLTYRYSYGNNVTSEYTPLNIGFGITYVLPIIVSILKAKKGDLLIIENPESHLHPAGQSKVAELCAIASANGVQIIVETHSDHFLNGIRVATKNKIIKPEQSQVYYFRKEDGELETIIDKINIDKNGGIDRYPKGFFDQFDDDLDALLGL